MTTTDLVVVGGGLAGLGAAALAATHGLRVTVLEKATAPGGRAATQDLHGFAMNLGPHALYLGGAARRVLEGLGVSTAGRSPPVSGGLALHGDTLHALPTGFVSLLTTGLLDLRGKLAFGRILATASTIDPAPLVGVTARAWLESAVEDPVARDAIAMFLRLSTYAADLERMSAGAALAQLRIAVHPGVRYVDGGWRTFVDGLGRVARTGGADVRTNVKASRVIVERGRVRGVVTTAGETIEAPSVILAVAPRAAAMLAPDAPEIAGWADAARPVRAACLDLGLARLPRPEARLALGADRPLYFSVHSASARLTPSDVPDAALVHVAKYLAEDEDGDVERELEGFVERVQPGFRDHVVARRFLPSLVVSNALVTAEAGGVAGRPGPPVPSVHGLLVAGDWVGGEGMLADASLASADAAIRRVMEGRAGSRAA